MAEIEQGSPEWFAARLGKVTASRVADVIAKTKTGWGASRTNYAAELVAERLTGASACRNANPCVEHSFGYLVHRCRHRGCVVHRPTATAG